jgi:hypothetical protein
MYVWRSSSSRAQQQRTSFARRRVWLLHGVCWSTQRDSLGFNESGFTGELAYSHSQKQHRTLTSRSSSWRGSAAFAVASLSTAPPACRSLMLLILGCDCSTAWHTRGLRLECSGVATEFVVCCCLWLAPRRVEGSAILSTSFEMQEVNSWMERIDGRWRGGGGRGAI